MSDPVQLAALRTNKYVRQIPLRATVNGESIVVVVTLDFYDIADAYQIHDSAIAHALKKLLRYGSGTKSLEADVDEAIRSLRRWQEQNEEKSDQAS